jgi:hypothetical protein
MVSMCRRQVWLIPLILLGCGKNSDVGVACPMQVPPPEQKPEAGAVDFPTYIEINTQFPCDSLVCVTTQGRDPYCSQECRSDSTCPGAFECRVVTDSGPLASKKYCVWRRCHVQLECGDVARYKCLEGNYGSDVTGLCAPIAGGASP